MSTDLKAFGKNIFDECHNVCEDYIKLRDRLFEINEKILSLDSEIKKISTENNESFIRIEKDHSLMPTEKRSIEKNIEKQKALITKESQEIKNYEDIYAKIEKYKKKDDE
jgi:hypothetical protein